MSNVIKEAKKYLESLHRVYKPDDCDKYSEMVFLLPEDVVYQVKEDSTIVTKGLSAVLDNKERDLINPIICKNALKMEYQTTNILTPLTYAESLPDILWHITTQAILYTKVTADLINWIDEIKDKIKYGKHAMDEFWLSCSSPFSKLKAGDYICIFNRRVGGWDGSVDRPVIELLGAGGHLPSVWDSGNQCFRTLSFLENLQKEAEEELELSFKHEDIHIFGGYNNEITHELVILAGIEISAEVLPRIESFAVGNIKQDTMGVYLGTFPEVIKYYRQNPDFFAGGRRAAVTNFPFQLELMKIVEEFFLKKGVM